MSKALRALIVEDRSDDVDLMLHELQRSGYAVERWAVDSKSDYVAALDREPDVILCDYSMVRFNAPQALRLLRDKGCDIPFIVVTGSISEEVVVECMKEGAADYIIKDRLTRLGPAIGLALKAKASRDAQRRTEAALCASEERFERAVTAAHVGTWDWDLQTGQIVWSDENVRMFGLRAEDFDGRYETFTQCIHTEDRARIAEAVDRARKDRTLYDQEFRVRWPDGTERWLHATGQFIYDEAGRAVRMAGVVQDVTERKRAEEAMHQKEAQLRQAQKMEVVGALASGIAHDINNLLTVIYGSVEAARLVSPADPELAELLDRVEEAAQQAAGVTKGLLAFARQTPPEKKVVNLCEVIDRATRFLKRMLPATIELTVDRVENPPIWVHGDETHLQQMVLNLAINARDAMPDGGSLRIRIAHVPIADAGPLAETSADAVGFARLQVIDTGTGMSPEIMGRIFDPFFTTKPRGQGTGLGLAITRSIVEEHGGHLAVESASGKGTTFTFTMPCVAPDMEPSAAAAAPVDVRGHGELILVVEDYQPVRDLVVAALRARGYKVVSVADGHAALREYDQHRTNIRALILDLDVPKCSGCDVLRAIRSNGSGVPVIVVTGRVEAGLEQSLDSRSTVLRKPFRVADLVDHLGRQLRAREKTDALP